MRRIVEPRWRKKHQRTMRLLVYPLIGHSRYAWHVRSQDTLRLSFAYAQEGIASGCRTCPSWHQGSSADAGRSQCLFIVRKRESRMQG